MLLEEAAHRTYEIYLTAAKGAQPVDSIFSYYPYIT